MLLDCYDYTDQIISPPSRASLLGSVGLDTYRLPLVFTATPYLYLYLYLPGVIDLDYHSLDSFADFPASVDSPKDITET